MTVAFPRVSNCTTPRAVAGLLHAVSTPNALCTRRRCSKTGWSLWQGDRTSIFWQAQNWDRATAKTYWAGFSIMGNSANFDGRADLGGGNRVTFNVSVAITVVEPPNPLSTAVSNSYDAGDTL